jgi:hypothetical protein
MADVKQMEVSPKEAAELLRMRTNGAFFTVTFIKRSNGDERTMNCRKGVTSFLKNGEQRYNPADHDLVTVFDIPKKQYRTIPVENIKRIAADKVVYTVVLDKK